LMSSRRKSAVGRMSSPLNEPGKGELEGLINPEEKIKIEFSLFGPHVGEVDVKVADGILLEAVLLGGTINIEIRQTNHAVA
jgi:hypothetical protein